jgi:serine/threonine protein kinase
MQRAVIGEGVAKALNYLHTRKGKPLIHGDVKSANILLDSQMQPKLGDFGLAKFLHGFGTRGQYTHMTVTSVHGTVAYLPPEYLRNKILSPAVDVYSYGVVMFEMATGKRAFDGKNLLADTIAEELDEANHCSCAVNRSSTKADKRNDLLQLIEPHCECRITKKAVFKDPRLTSDNAFGYWFDILLSLGLVCCNRSKRKRPTFAKMLQLYDEMERLRTCSQFFPSNGTRHTTDAQLDTEPIQTPFELHLWQQIVQREPNTLPTGPSSCSQVLSRPTELLNISATKGTLVGSPLPLDLLSLTQSSHMQQSQHHQQSPDSESGNCIIPLITELGINNDPE